MQLPSVPCLAIALAAGTLSPAIAAPLTELSLGDTPLQNQTLSAGAMQVVITDYRPNDFATDDRGALSYEVYVNDELKASHSEEADFMFADFSLQNLDPDGLSEVIFHRYTGGAHCCSIYRLYSWQGDRLHRTQTYPLDASAVGSFEDLDKDGYSELVGADGRFLYAFGSYASSWPPTLVLSFRGGTLIDVSQQFSDMMRANAANMYQSTYTSTLQEPMLGANSILAGYVAQKIMLGEYESGWDYMLAHYDPTDTWGLEHYNTAGEVSETFADFPAALEAFLIDLEYLTVNGTPNPHLDLSRSMVEQESLL
ncbi:MAG: hypothetical protein AAFO87_03915 [Cyanobacteria bacterium J06607_6]